MADGWAPPDPVSAGVPPEGVALRFSSTTTRHPIRRIAPIFGVDFGASPFGVLPALSLHRTPAEPSEADPLGPHVGLRLTPPDGRASLCGAMPTYVYETIPTTPGQKARRFEVKQSMKDAPLRFDPESGQPVHRVISGGFAPMLSGTGAETPCDSGACSLPTPTSHGCGPACGCVGN